MMDIDKSGFIQKESVLAFRGDQAVLKILKPILEEITIKHLKITLSEFEEKMDLLLTRISANERMVLLDVKL